MAFTRKFLRRKKSSLEKLYKPKIREFPIQNDFFIVRHFLATKNTSHGKNDHAYKTDDPVYGDVVKILLLAQFLGVKNV